jgi:hypothetical protein
LYDKFKKPRPVNTTGASPIETKKNENEIWTKVTFLDTEMRTVTKVFKNSRVRVAHNVNNTIKSKCKINKPHDIYSNCGVYQLKCISCDQVYISHTGREFKTRFNEHIRDIRYTQNKSKYAQHILNHNQKCGTIESTMDIIRLASKGKNVDALERFYIYKASKSQIIINEQYAFDSDVLFDLIINRDKNKIQ